MSKNCLIILPLINRNRFAVKKLPGGKTIISYSSKVFLCVCIWKYAFLKSIFIINSRSSIANFPNHNLLSKTVEVAEEEEEEKVSS